MGIIKQGILGGFSGKVANVVGSSWKGIAVMKSLPLSVANPRTASQVHQRDKFSVSIGLGSVLLSNWVKPLWDRWAQRMSGFNAFCSKNIELANLAQGEEYKDFVMSSGKMSETIPSSIYASIAAEQVEVEWADDAGQGLKLATDILYISGIGNDLSKILKLADPTVRSGLSALVNVNWTPIVGEKAYLAVAFLRSNGTIVSDSKMIEFTFVA